MKCDPIKGKIGSKFGAKSGTKIQKNQGAFVRQLFFPNILSEVVKKAVLETLTKKQKLHDRRWGQRPGQCQCKAFGEGLPFAGA